MAVTSGTVTTNTVSKSYFYVAWSQVSQSIANNQTTINWVAGINTGTSSSHDSFYSNAVKINNVYINGTLVSNGGTWSNIKTGGNHDLVSGTSVINHNADGTKTFSVSINGWTYPSSNYSGSNSFELTTIPRQATVTNGTDFNDEQNPTIYYSNPAGNSVSSLQAYIENANNSQVLVGLRDISKTGTSYTFPLTTTERNSLRNAIPNNKTLSVRLVVRTILGGNTYFSWTTKTMTIVNANPTIDDIQYLDTNTDTTDITNDDQIIIQNLSTLQFQLYDIASKKGASLSSLSVNINGNVKTTTYSGTAIASSTYNYNEVDVSNDTTAVVTITDSRGNKTSYNVPLTIWEYFQPTAIISVSRENNFYTESHITVDGNYASLNNLNTIDIQYRIKKSSDNSWGNWTSISDNVQDDFNADNQYAWDVQVKLEDLIGTTNTYTINKALDVGIPMVFYDVMKRSVGVNCFPVNDGTLEIDGDSVLDIYSSNETIVGRWIDDSIIYRKVINFGNLPNNAIKDVAHNISNLDQFVNLRAIGYRSAADTYYPIPYYTFESTYSIQLYASPTNVTIRTSADRSDITAYVIVEYTKSSS